jgi:hypothetical protein
MTLRYRPASVLSQCHAGAFGTQPVFDRSRQNVLDFRLTNVVPVDVRLAGRHVDEDRSSTTDCSAVPRVGWSHSASLLSRRASISQPQGTNLLVTSNGVAFSRAALAQDTTDRDGGCNAC